ncbi:MAG: TonB-dependent receptor [Bacteroidales bacterium]|jgi:TonB-linked SusC/RagA family outer membrane protein|nr:TonB-dependent receptor [Bacteroidales bacterium]
MKKLPDVEHFKRKSWKGVMIMTNTFVLTFLFAINLSAMVAGQSVSIDIKKGSLKDCLNEIEKQTGLGFLYSSSDVNLTSDFKVKLDNVSVNEALETILAGTKLQYEIDNKVILIKNKEIELVPLNLIDSLAGELQQRFKVSGIIKDETGQPMFGVTIIEKGTVNGTSTDAEGKYTIQVADANAKLNFSFLGYFSEEKAVNGQSSIDLIMREAVNEIEEAVVIGYGSAKKKDLTGSVVRISSEVLENTGFTSTGQILQGQVSGMEVLGGNGRPGDQVRIRIRGESSLQGDASPLIVIDEVPMPDSYDLNLLNPNDIQSIDVLKGASAAAIYGSKGSSGVLLITTRQGKQGGFEIFYNGNVSSQAYSTKIQGLSTEDYKEMVTRGVMYNYQYAKYATPKANLDIRTTSNFTGVAVPGYFGEAETDWTDYLTQTPINTNHMLGIRGGSKEASYYASFGYTKDKGKIIGNESQRMTANLKMDLRPTRYFEMGFNVSAASYPVRRSLFGGDWGAGDGMLLVYKARPDVPAYDESGDYFRFWSTGHNRYLDNPLQMANEAPAITKNFNYNINGYGRILFTKDLRYQLTFSYAASQYEGSLYYGSYTYTGSGGYYRGVDGELHTNSGYSNQLNLDNVIYYTKTTGRHDISLMAGATFNQDKDGNLNQIYQNFPDDYIQNTVYNATKWVSSSGSDDASAFYSLYGRANYKFGDRYLVTGTIRRDASSKFAPQYRAGWFPSVAVAWVLSEESFLKDNGFGLSFLKLRTGWGVTGNNRIGRYSWRTMFGGSEYFGQAGTIPVSIGNDEVRWEETSQIDIATDFGFFKNRLMGTFGYYYKFTDGLLFGYSLSPSAGLTSVNQNIGQIENQGLEFEMKAQIIENSDWSLFLGFNIAGNRGKVLNLDKDIAGDAYGNAVSSGATSVLKVGEPLGLIYGYRIAGVYQTAQQAYETSIAQSGNYAQLGRYYYKDLNEDGKIDALYDREVIGKTEPDFFGGLYVDARYKKLTLRVAGKFSVGAQKHWTGLQDQFHANLSNPANVLEYALWSWTPNNPTTIFQRFGAGWEKGVADNYLFDASYFKLTDITLGYDLPEAWVKKIGLSTVNFYGSVNNIFTLTTYPGTNVEAYSSGIAGAAQDFSIYPLTRTFTLGVKIMMR